MSAPPSEDFPTLGRYQVINRIASGGMAEVFLAKAVGAMGFQRLVAVKLIHANFTRDPEFVKMFIDEARIAMHLHHRNIVQVFDLDSEEDTYFIAMEFVHGVNLYDLYERIASKGRWIEVPMALYLVAEVSKGLHFAHTRSGPDGRPLGIVHRDISPQNVLLSFEGEVKITDFGIATAAERLHQTAAGIVKGKYAYMAPERLQEKPIDARVDVFSVGVLLYELLVGENPFAGASAVDTIENVLGRDVPPPSSRGAPVSRQLDEICLKALAKDPNERYASGQALADAVTEYAMELTSARKDMAAGDSAVASLLQEMFPEKARTQPGALDPSAISLPGFEAKPKPVTTTEPTPVASDGLRPTEEDLSVPGPGLLDEETADDFDAPTLLKMSALDGPGFDPRVQSLDEPSTQKSQDSLPSLDSLPERPNSGLSTLETPQSQGALDATAPTELPPGPGGRGGPDDTLEQPAIVPNPHLPSIVDDDEGFAETVPSQNSLDVLDDPALAPTAPAPPADLPHAPMPQVGLVMPQMPAVRGSNPPMSPPMGHAYPATFGESQDQLVVPVSSSDLAHGTSEVPVRGSKMNVIAGGLLIVAVLVVAAALFVVRQGEVELVQVPLTITSIPPGALIKINGADHAVPTPANLDVSANERLELELSLPGYLVAKKSIVPLEGTPVTVEVKLEATSGTLIVRPSESTARVLVDGKDRGNGTVAVQGLPLGEEVPVRVELDGFEAYETRVTLTKDSPKATVAAPMEKATRGRRAASTRKVFLQAPYGTWANVYHSGKRIGTTPTEATLPIGKVKLQVRNDEAKIDKTITVNVSRSGDGKIQLQF